jgi:PAS domain S-box-containing protein
LRKSCSAGVYDEHSKQYAFLGRFTVMSGKIDFTNGEFLILVVEDSPTQAEKLKVLFEQQNYKVRCACNGGVALEIINQVRPTLVVSDVVMPGMDGYELCRQIKADENLRSIPVMLVTALFAPIDVMRGLECGADTFVLKPYTDDAMLLRARSLIENAQAGQQAPRESELIIEFEQRRHAITAGRATILNLLLSTYEAVNQRNKELRRAQDELWVANQRLKAANIESAERFRQLAEYSSEGFWFIAFPPLRVLFVNPALENILGIQADVVYEHPSSLLSLLHPDDENRVQAIWMDFVEGRSERMDSEFRIVRPDGSERWVLLGGTAIRDSAGTHSRGGGLLKDISERKEAEAAVLASLAEKEVLLKEIHHRVKNNLQVIASMLNLQRAMIPDPQARGILNASQNRIRSMALIHETLYRSPDLAHLDFSTYIHGLVRALRDTFAHESERVAFTFNINALLDIDTAVPCGLIVNELLTNALKYAFPDGQRGEVNITVTRVPEGGYELSVRDSGIGMPEHFNLSSSSTLGLRLVNSLATQLGGALEVQSIGGAQFTIRFPEGQRRK